MIYIHLYCDLRRLLPFGKNCIIVDSSEIITMEDIFNEIGLDKNEVDTVICNGHRIEKENYQIINGEHIHIIPMMSDG